MSLKPDVIRLYQQEAGNAATPWVIWVERNSEDAPAFIPDFVPTYYYRKGAYVYHDGRIWKSDRIILRGAFEEKDWTEVQQKVGFLGRYDSDLDYELDEYILDGTGQLLRTLSAFDRKPYDVNDWEVVLTSTEVETATVYLDVLGEQKEEVVEDGIFVRLGGIPENYSPFEGMTAIETYFAEKKRGAWFDFSSNDLVFTDLAGTVSAQPGERVALVKEVDNRPLSMIQPDVNLRPIYQESESGVGYLIFNDQEHLSITTPFGKDNMEYLSGVPGTGDLRFKETNPALSVFRYGPTFPAPTKTWYLNESVMFFENVDPIQFEQMCEEISLRTWNLYSSSLVKDMSSFFLDDPVFNQDIGNWKMFGKENLARMFEGATAFNQDITDWDVQTVTDIAQIFKGASAFNQPIGNWSFADLKIAKGAFQNTTSFNQPLHTWDVFGLVDVSFMFAGATAFNSRLNGWNLATVTNAESMFDGAELFDQPLTTLGMDSVINMTNMFRNCKVFDQDLDAWNISNVTSLTGTFEGASVFNGSLLSWITEENTSLVNTFKDCLLFDQPLNHWNTFKVTNMERTFEGATAFNQELFEWETDNVTTMLAMFNGATLFDRDISNWCVRLINAKPTDFDTASAFVGMTALQPKWNTPCLKYFTHAHYDAADIGTLWQDVGGTIPVTNVGDKVLRMDDQSAQLNHALAVLATAPTYRQDANGRGYLEFNNDERMSFADGGATYNSWETIPGVGTMLVEDTDTEIGPKTSGAQKRYLGQMVVMATPYGVIEEGIIEEYMATEVSDYPSGTITNLESYMEGLTSFNTPVNDWNMTDVVNIQNMFKDAISFNQPLDTWDVSNVVTMQSTFENAQAFNQDISSWTTTSLVNLDGTFKDASLFNQNINWETTNVNTMRAMFQNAGSFNSTVGFSRAMVANMDNMFEGAAVFNQPVVGPSPELLSAIGMFKDAVNFNAPVTDLVGAKTFTIERMFDNARKFNQDLSTWDTTALENMFATFRGALLFNGAMTGWSTPALNNIEQTFKNTPVFNQEIDNWDVSNVTSLEQTFSGATSFNKPIGSWNTGNVTSLKETFVNAAAFDQDIELWNVSNVLTMESMFQGATVFNQFLEKWNVENVTNFDFAFRNATLFNTDISMWCVRSIPVTGPNAFNDGGILDVMHVPIWGANCIADLADLWYNPADITTMFTEVAGITPPVPGDKVARIDDVGNFGINAIQTDPAKQPIYREDANGMGYLEFKPGDELVATGVSGTGLWVSNVPSVGGYGDFITTPSSIFEMKFDSSVDASAILKMGQVLVNYGSPSAVDVEVLDRAVGRWARDYVPGTVTDIRATFMNNADFDWDISNWETQLVEVFDNLFRNCDVFNTDISIWDVSSANTMTSMFKNARLFNQEIGTWTMDNVIDVTSMFEGAYEFNGAIQSWKMDNVVSFERTFANAKKFNQSITTWRPIALLSMESTFDGALAFDQDLSGWDTSNVTTFKHCFRDAQAFNKPLVTWDVSGAVDVTGMFDGALRFNRPLNTWVFNPGLLSLEDMFRDTEDFNQDLSNWDVSVIENFKGMFAGTNSFDGNIVSWTFNGTNINFDEMFKDAFVFNQDISGWDTTNADRMVSMFQGAVAFNRTLTSWCVRDVVPPEEADFGLGAGIFPAQYPLFGEICLGEILSGLYDAALKSSLGTNPDGTGVPGPGDKVAFVADISGSDNHAVQPDVTLRPTYQEDINGRGYLIFTKDQHLVASGITQPTENQIGICGRGKPHFVNQDNTGGAKLGIKYDGGTVDKVWYWGAEAISEQTLDDAGRTTISDSINSRKDAYPDTLMTSIQAFMANEQALTGGMKDFNVTGYQEMDRLFQGCSTFDEDITAWDMTGIITLSSMFEGASIFNQDISGWTFNNAVSFDRMFKDAVAFNQDLTSWNVTKGENFTEMFAGTSVFNNGEAAGASTAPLTWSIVSVDPTGLVGVFDGASAFNQSLASWNVDTVTNLSRMFKDAVKFNQPLSSWNVGTVVTFNEMFSGASEFNQPLGGWNTENVTSMTATFKDAVDFDQDISAWCVSKIASKPTDFDTNTPVSFSGSPAKHPRWGSFCLVQTSEFYYDPADAARVWTTHVLAGDAASVLVTAPGQTIAMIEDGSKHGRHMIQSNIAERPIYREDAAGKGYVELGPNQTLIITAPVTADIYTSVITAGKMRGLGLDFTSGISVKEIFSNPGYGTHKLGLIAGMVPTVSTTDKTEVLNIIKNIALSYTAVSQTSLASYFRKNSTFNSPDLLDWETGHVVDFSDMFHQATNFNQNIGSWDMGSSQDLHNMFAVTDAFNQDVSSWDTSNVTDMSGMFASAIAFENGGVSLITTSGGWDTSSVVDMTYMFNNASQFNQNIVSWDTSNVESMAFMFKDNVLFNNGGAALATTPGGWDTSSVTTMNAMFNSAVKFNQSISTWDTSSVANFNEMFKAADLFNQDLSGISLAATDITMRSMFENTSAFNNAGVALTWNTSNVIDMNGLFKGADAFNQPIESWDVGRVHNTGEMFRDALVFDQPIAGWNVAGVQNATQMFRGTAMFDQPLTCWDWASIVDGNFDEIFRGALAFDQDLSGWCIPGLTSAPSDPFKDALIEAQTNKHPVWANMSSCVTGSLTSPNSLAVFDPRDMSTLWTDTVGGTNVSAVGQAVLAITDISGAGNHATVNGTVTYYEDVNDIGYLAIGSGGSIEVTGLNQAVDIAFIVPGVGDTFVSHATETDPKYWGKASATSVGPMAFTDSGYGSTVSGMECINYVPGTITSISKMFEDEIMFDQDLSDWDVSQIATFSSVFYNAQSYNNGGQPLVWDMSECLNLSTMFAEAHSFNQDISGLKIRNTGGANINMDSMFRCFFGISSFNNGGMPLTTTVNGWDVSKVSRMENMFNAAGVFNQDISQWNTGNVTNMANMFSNAYSFNNGGQSLPHVPGKWDISGSTTCQQMFFGASSFNQDVSSWRIHPTNPNIKMMFWFATSFDSNLNSWNTDHVTSFTRFLQNSAFTNAGVRPTWSTANATDVSYMLADLPYFDLPMDDFDFGLVTNAGYLFSNSDKFNQDMNGISFPSVTSIKNMFSNCDVFNNGDPIGVSTNPFTMPINTTIGAVDTSSLFSGAKKFNQDVSNFDTSGANKFTSMFSLASDFNNGEVPLIETSGGWTVPSAVTDMSFMFRQSNFNQDISGWDMSNVLNLKAIFQSNMVFNQPIGKWNVSNVTSMEDMFKSALDFNQSLTCWDLSSVIKMDDMFNGAVGFEQDISGWCVPNITAEPPNFSASTSAAMVDPDWTNMGSCTPGSISSPNALAAFDPRFMNTLWTDTVGGTNVTGPGQVVKAISDISGNGNHATVSGTVYYREDANGMGFLALRSAGTIRINGLNQAVDIAFMVPGIGHTFVSHATETDPKYWGKSTATEVGPIAFLTSGNGGTVSGMDCFTYAPGTTTKLACLFENESLFNEPIGDWDTSHVTDMQRMFDTATIFNQDLSSWDTSNVTTMTYMFDDAKAFDQDVSNWNTSKVTAMTYMFRKTDSFNNGGVPLTAAPGKWDVSKVTSFSGMFTDAKVFNQDINSWVIRTDTSVNMSRMFWKSKAFDQNINNWDTSSVTNMSWMFRSSVWNNGGVVPNFPTGNVTNFSYFLYRDADFNHSLDAFDFGNTTRAEKMLYGATGFNQNMNNLSFPVVTNIDEFLRYAEVFNNGEAPGTSTNPFTMSVNPTAGVVDMSGFFKNTDVFNQDVSGFVTSGAHNMASMLSDTGAFNQDVTNWDTSNVTNMSFMFYDAEVFNNGGVPLAVKPGGWNTSSVTNMSSMFFEATVFNQDISSWDTSSVTDMGFMFRQSNFNQDISGWDMSSVAVIKSMFQSTTMFNQPIGKWDVSNVTTMKDMFQSAQAFNQSLACWDLSSVTEMDDMFNGATGFEQDLSIWCVPNITAAPTRFDSGSGIDGQVAKQPNWANMGSCTPGSPFTGSNIIAIYDLTDPSTYFDDVTMLVPSNATASISVSALADISGNGNHAMITSSDGVTSSNLTVREINGKPSLRMTQGRYLSLAGIAQTQLDIAFLVPGVGQTVIERDKKANGIVFGEFQGTRDFGVIVITERGSGSTVSWHDCINYDVTGTDIEIGYLFLKNNSFNEDLSNWDFSNVTNMDNMLEGASTFNQDVNNWDISGLTSMVALFKNASAFNNGTSGNLSDNPLTWDTSNVGVFTSMFDGCNNFNQELPNLSFAGITDPVSDTQAIKVSSGYNLHVRSMFDSCSIFNQNLNHVDFSPVVYMKGMFDSATLFNNGGIIPNWDLSNVKSTTSLFRKTAFNHDINGFDFGNVLAADSMFNATTAFNNGSTAEAADNPITVSFPKLQIASGMFNGCTGFNQKIDTLVTSTCTTISRILKGTGKWNHPIATWDTSNVTTFYETFAQHSMFNQPVTGLVTASAESIKSMFKDATAFNQPLTMWDTSGVTDMSRAFSSAASFNQDVSGLDTSNVENMSFMFYNTASFNQDVSELNTGNVENMASMFFNARDFNNGGVALNQVVGKWNMSSVRSARDMFANADSFNVGVNNWSFGTSCNLTNLFRNCDIFNQDISSWDTSNVTSMTRMFSGATLFDQDLSGWCVTNITAKPSGFDDSSGFVGLTAKHPQWGTCP